MNGIWASKQERALLKITKGFRHLINCKPDHMVHTGFKLLALSAKKGTISSIPSDGILGNYPVRTEQKPQCMNALGRYLRPFLFRVALK